MEPNGTDFRANPTRLVLFACIGFQPQALCPLRGDARLPPAIGLCS